MKAIIVVDKEKAEIQEVSRPAVRDGFVLVKVNTLGLNPTDWKTITYRAVPGINMRVGADYAGIVEEVGNGVTNLKKGDRVAGVVMGGHQLEPDFGAFGDYLITQAALQIKIPDNITDEQAATIGVSMVTAAQGLYKILELPFPTTPAKEPYPILIYGGSTATGVYGIQFAKASGLTVVATASPRNFEYLKSLGADAVFDYNSPTCAADIKAFTNNALKLAWDCSGDGGEICAAALSDAETSRYATIVPVEREVVAAINPKVEGPIFHLAYDVFNSPYVWLDGSTVPAKPDEYEFAAKFVALVPGLLANGTVKPIRTALNQGGSGLEGVLKGLEDLKAGKVSGTKLVYTL
ncbi:alcohol dehydrogenase [Hypomontagnella monticulosa]|nr:alcohol dehydrogenase [Hypomontagnella monticulosa]